MSYEVRTEQFSGPLEKLLELIEERKLDINAVSLAAVTADFLTYLERIPDDVHPDILSDFVVVGAKLVFLKSKTLLPGFSFTEEEEGDIKDLASRLELYQELKGAARSLRAVWPLRSRSYARQFAEGAREGGIFYPPRTCTQAMLLAAAGRLIAVLQELLPGTAKVRAAAVRLEDKVRELLRRFEEFRRHTFQRIAEQRPKAEVIVLFLAVLHLLKQRLVKAEQGTQFGDIIIQKHGGV